MRKSAYWYRGFVGALLVAGIPAVCGLDPVRAAEGDPPAANQDDEAQQERIRELVGQLGDDLPEVRKNATEELGRIGSPAVGALEEATRSTDPEVRWRAKEALATIRSRQGGVPRRAPGSRTRARGPNGEESPSGGPQGLEELDELLEDMDLDKALSEPMREMMEQLRKMFGGQEQTPGEKNGKPRSSFRLHRITPGNGQWELDERFSELGAGTLGLEVSRVPGALRAHVELPPGAGVLLTQVQREGKAAAMGFKRYDVVVAINGEAVRSASDLTALLSVDQVEKVLLIREGEKLVLNLTEVPEESPEGESEPEKGSGQRRNY